MPPTSEEPAPATVTSTDAGPPGASSVLFRGRALAPQRAALPERQRLAQLRFGQPGNCEIEIVAAQQQVAAHGGSRELNAIAFAVDAHQSKVAGAAADVADQNIWPSNSSLFERARCPAIQA